jgi:predicted RNase H-like nuclease (RuvC/YqgF family)
MALTDTMRWMGRSARNRAEAMSHEVKDRVLETRLDKTSEENERLRTENRSLKDAVEESHAAHERILSLLEQHRDETEVDLDVEQKKSHKGRWFMFLMLLAGGAWAWMRNQPGLDRTDWGGRPAGTEDVGAPA